MSGDKADVKYRVVFLPDHTEVTVNRGTDLLTAAMSAGVHINASCGGSGVCGTCKVKIESGLVESIKQPSMTDDEYQLGIRQACKTRVLSDLVVTIPPASRLDEAVKASEKKKSSGVSVSGWKFEPPVSKYYLELPPATLDDNASDLFRLQRRLKQSYDLEDIPVDFNAIRKLPVALREGNWTVTVTVLVTESESGSKDQSVRQIINIEAGDTRQKLFALAVDVGTTTVCAQLLDLNRGKILSDSIVFNKQISYGSDVITRIAYCQKPGGLSKLQELVISSINEVIDNLLKNSNIERQDISFITSAGNTTMTHLLMGLEPKYLRLAPYTPAANFIPVVKAHSLGIKVPDHVYLFTFPSISSYVGGDIVSGVLASGIYQRKKLTFFMDIGTNGEIVIGNSEWLVTASCSAAQRLKAAVSGTAW
jgi:uncharacterized 2Fe-2S/4Fe-4S cluster protein (DUF4445 family)